MLFRLAGQRDERSLPALSIETIRVAQGASTYWCAGRARRPMRSRSASATGIGAIRVGESQIDTDARGRMILYDTGHRPARFVSARAVLNGTVPADKIDGQIVFIGTCAIGLKDMRSTPVDRSRCPASRSMPSSSSRC